MAASPPAPMPRTAGAPVRAQVSTMPAGPMKLGPEFAVTQPGLPGPQALEVLRRAAADDRARAARAPAPEPEPPAEEEMAIDVALPEPMALDADEPAPTRVRPVPASVTRQLRNPNPEIDPAWADPDGEEEERESGGLDGLFDDVSSEYAARGATAEREGLMPSQPAPQFADELLDEAPASQPPEEAPGEEEPLASDSDLPPATDEDLESMPTRDLRDRAAQAAETMPPQKWGALPTADVMARPASTFRLLLAWTIDAALWAAVSGAYFYLQRPKGAAALHGAEAALLWVKSLGPRALVGGAIAAGLWLLYTAIFTVALQGRTPGRLVAGVRLLTRRGQPPGAIRAVFRTGFAVLSVALCGAGYWLALFDRKSQTLHDKLTGTFVVRLDS